MLPLAIKLKNIKLWAIWGLLNPQEPVSKIKKKSEKNSASIFHKTWIFLGGPFSNTLAQQSQNKTFSKKSFHSTCLYDVLNSCENSKKKIHRSFIKLERFRLFMHKIRKVPCVNFSQNFKNFNLGLFQAPFGLKTLTQTFPPKIHISQFWVFMQL